MRPGYDESPLNPLPPVIWLLVLPIIATEAAAGLAQIGLIGGAQGIGMRLAMLERAAFVPDLLIRLAMTGQWEYAQPWRIVTYPFVHGSLTHALFVAVFTLALGKLVAEQFRALSVLAIFFGSAIGGALVYTALAAWLPGRFEPLIGGYPAVYGLVGAFTFLLWVRLGVENANQLRAFSLIGMLLLFQLVFGLIFGGAGHGWIAEIAGFVIGFLLSFLLVPGGWDHVMRRVRAR